MKAATSSWSGSREPALRLFQQPLQPDLVVALMLLGLVALLSLASHPFWFSSVMTRHPDGSFSISHA